MRLGTVLLLCCSICAIGQTVKVADTTEPGSGVTLTGTITPTTAEITGHNSGTQEILAIVVYAKLNGQVYHFQHESFFKGFEVMKAKHDFAVTRKFNLPIEVETISKADGSNAHTLPPAPIGGTAKVVWVQWADGSTWGDQKIGAEIFAQRPQVEAFLHTLLNAYNTGGAEALNNALNAEQPPKSITSGMAYSLQMFERDNGVDGLVTNIKSRLAAAEVRRSKLK